MTFLASGRAFTRAWSSQIAAAVAGVTGLLMTLDPTILQAGWQTMPAELRALVPANIASYITLGLCLAVMMRRSIPRPSTGLVLGLLGRVAPAPMIVGPVAIGLLHHFERCRLVAYRCPAGVWTIGWGMTYYPNGKRVRAGDRITQVQADDMFEQLLARDFAPAVTKAIGAAATSPAQFGAMVALAYNIGAKAFAGSSVTRFHKAGDAAAAEDAFALFNKADGKVSSGLVRRRRAEAALYASNFLELKLATFGEVSA